MHSEGFFIEFSVSVFSGFSQIILNKTDGAFKYLFFNRIRHSPLFMCF